MRGIHAFLFTDRREIFLTDATRKEENSPYVIVHRNTWRNIQRDLFITRKNPLS